VTAKLAGFKYTINGEIGGTGTKSIVSEDVTILEVANAGDITIKIEKLLLSEKPHTELKCMIST
jgi:hypothetical protein